MYRNFEVLGKKEKCIIVIADQNHSYHTKLLLVNNLKYDKVRIMGFF